MKSKLIGLFLAMLFVAGMTVPVKVFAAPSALGYVYAKGIGSMSVGVNWEKVSTSQGYYIYRSLTQTGTYVKVGEVAGADNTYFLDRDHDPATTEIEPLSAATDYFYKVSAYDDSGESALSEVSSHTYTDKDGETASEILSRGKTHTVASPKGVQVVDNNNMTVTIKWSESEEPNIGGYNVYRSEASGGTKVKVNAQLVTNLEYADSVTFNKDYYYSVSAVDDQNREGKLSAEFWIKPIPQAGKNSPHVKFEKNAKECAYCHGAHSASGQDLITKVSEAEVCFVCHDGTGSSKSTYQEFNGDYPSKHPMGENGLNCASCHDAHLDSKVTDEAGQQLYPAILRPVSVDGNMIYKGNEQCYKCHGVGSALKGGDHKTAFEDSIHGSSTSMAQTSSGSGIQCSACHQPHAGPNANLKPFKEENACFACHSGNASASKGPDVYNRISSKDELGSGHDLLLADRQKTGAKLQCVNCHNPHGVNEESKVVDPTNPSPGGSWTGSQKDFCLKCHSGSLPSGEQSLPYAPAVSAGTKTLTNIAATSSTSSHVAKLDCSACHNSHGSINPYSLKTSTTSYFTGELKEGLFTYNWDYKKDETLVRGTDTRVFCSSCHSGSAHIESQSFPTDCLSCHKHGNGL